MSNILNISSFHCSNSECSIFLEVDCSIYHPDSPVAESLKDIIEDILVGNVTTGNHQLPQVSWAIKVLFTIQFWFSWHISSIELLSTF